MHGKEQTKPPSSKREKRIFRDKIVEFLEKNKLITENQHGFCNNKSCLTNLFDLFNDVSTSWDFREPYDVI